MNRIKKAKEFYSKAIEEFKKAKEINSDVLFRDSAEKGWNAIVLATNHLIEKLTKKLVRSNRERRKMLDQIEFKNGNLRKYNFYERFAARAYVLHERCFYDGIYEKDELERNLKKVYLYIRDVEKVVNQWG